MKLNNIKSKLKTLLKFYFEYTPILFIVSMLLNAFVFKHILFTTLIVIVFSISTFLPGIKKLIYLILSFIIFVIDNKDNIKSTLYFLITTIFYLFITTVTVYLIFSWAISHFKIIVIFNNPFPYILLSISYVIVFSCVFYVYLLLYREFTLNKSANYKIAISLLKFLSTIITTVIIGFYNSIVEYTLLNIKENINIKQLELININLVITSFLYIFVSILVLTPLILKSIFLKENP